MWQSLTYTSFEQPGWPWKKKCRIWREVLKWIPINGSKVILKLLDGKTHQTWGYLNSGTHMNWKFLSKNWNLAHLKGMSFECSSPSLQNTNHWVGVDPDGVPGFLVFDHQKWTDED